MVSQGSVPDDQKILVSLFLNSSAVVLYLSFGVFDSVVDDDGSLGLDDDDDDSDENNSDDDDEGFQSIYYCCSSKQTVYDLKYLCY